MSSPAATANTNTASHDEEPSRPRVVSNLPPVQQVRTNHLGYDLGSGSGSGTHHFQIFAKVNGATKTIDVASEWTESDVKAALVAKTGRFLADECYLVASGGKAMNDGDVTTIGKRGVGKGGQLEVRYRARGGGGSMSLSHRTRPNKALVTTIGMFARLSSPDRGAEKAAEKAVAAETASTSEPASATAQFADVQALGQSMQLDVKLLLSVRSGFSNHDRHLTSRLC